MFNLNDKDLKREDLDFLAKLRCNEYFCFKLNKHLLKGKSDIYSETDIRLRFRLSLEDHCSVEKNSN